MSTTSSRSSLVSFREGAGFLISRLGGMVEKEGGSLLRDVGLTQAEFAILATLADGAMVRQRDLAIHVGSDPRNIVPVVASLTDRGLVEVAPALEDRRVKQIRLSVEGADLLDTVQIMLAPSRAKFFRGLSDAEYDQLCHLLRVVYSSAVSV